MKKQKQDQKMHIIIDEKGGAEEMVEIRCQRCGHQWNYNGKSEWYTSCPRCKTTINVRKIIASEITNAKQ